MNFIAIARFMHQYRYAMLFAAIFMIYFFNMFIDVMEVDAAQYALISMEMSVTRSFLHVFERGQDYLDKPPLLFWLSSLSMIVLGISNFAYKLPSVLLALVGVYSLYRFSLLWYSKEKAILSSLILASCQALFLITNDIRTDTNLLGLVVFSIWQINAYVINAKWKHLILAAIGIAGAMMAKGPIALIIPAAAFGTHFIIKRQWSTIFKPQWIVMLLVVAILLLPMSYGLYTQFDMHPEKFVYDMQGPSGLKFFFWTQSFGRITGENYWQNDTSYFYFLHTILWDFQPWVFLFIPALVLKFIKLALNRFSADQNDEFISLGAFVLVFVALSLSNYKLPHYIFVLFPFAAIITANFIYDLHEKIRSRISIVLFSVMHILWLVMAIDFIFFFPPQNAILPIVLAVLFAVNWYLFMNFKGKVEQIFIPTIITAISFNLLMALNFYPNLLQYQASSQVGKFIDENKIPNDMFYAYDHSSLSLDFYAKRFTPTVTVDSMSNIKPKSLVFIDENGLDELKENDISFKILKNLPSYKVTALRLPFLYAKTREQTLERIFLIEKQ